MTRGGGAEAGRRAGRRFGGQIAASAAPAPPATLFLPLCFRGTATHLSRRTVAVLTCAPRVFPDGTNPAARSPLGHLGPRSRAQDVTAQVQATARHRGANQLQTQSPARARAVTWIPGRRWGVLLPIRCSTFSSRTSRPRLEISEVPPGGFLVLLTWSLFLCLFRGQSRERFSGKIYQYIISSCLYFKFNIRVIISVSLVFYIYIYLLRHARSLSYQSHPRGQS